MLAEFLHSFQSEWFKIRRSSAIWLVVVGGFFIPVMMLIARLAYSNQTVIENNSVEAWHIIFVKSWQFMAFFLLPMAVILITSLITQQEFKNNAWKQLHALPLRFTTIFFSKLSVVILCIVLLLVFFNIGIYLSGVLPALLFSKVPYPVQSFPLASFLIENGKYFLGCLPIIALQYLLSLNFKNFLVAVGVGLLITLGSLFIFSWEHSYIDPYLYCTLQYFGAKAKIPSHINIYYFSIFYFVIFIVSGYIFYVAKKNRS